MKVNITVPVYNEEKVLASSVHKLLKAFGKETEILVADNGSTDRTGDIARKLAKQHKNVRHVLLKQKGRGRALKKAWSGSKADIVSYMDVDLSTDIRAFPLMVKAIEQGADIAYGSRLDRGSRTTRSAFREFLSRSYNILVRTILATNVRDAQCGFKALRREVFLALLPDLKDNEWFFDTELLLIAEKKGCRLKAIPVRWKEDPDSKVKIFDTVMKYLRDMMRLRSRLRRL